MTFCDTAITFKQILKKKKKISSVKSVSEKKKIVVDSPTADVTSPGFDFQMVLTPTLEMVIQYST